MTVAEIQKYIDEHIDDDEEVHTTQELRTLYGNTLLEIRSMLDELEPKAKWKHDGSQWENRFICSNCGHKIFEEQQPYCSNCGARMESEQ